MKISDVFNIIIKNKKQIIVAVFILITAWWFRYDIECGGNSIIACVAYDRFTGEFVLPINEVRKN